MPTHRNDNEVTVSIRNDTAQASAPNRFGALVSRLAAPFARRYVAGVKLTDALENAAALKRAGFATTMDHLGESVTNAGEARTAAEQYVIMLRALKEQGLDRNVSVKLTQIGLAIDPELCHENLKRIVATAEAMGGFVRVDMEGSDVTQATLDQIARVKNSRGSPVGGVLQAMLKRTPMDLVDLLEKGTTVRLCKGAYKEPPDIAHQEMRAIRREFMALAKRLLTSGLFHGIATHDTELIEAVKAFAREQRLEPSAFEFQMLLGFRPSVQRKLVAEGWGVRIYVPFGRQWLPYMLRRLRERKENVWFFMKTFFQW